MKNWQITVELVTAIMEYCYFLMTVQCLLEMSLKQPKRESPVSLSSEKTMEGKPEVESCSVRAGDASDIEVSFYGF